MQKVNHKGEINIAMRKGVSLKSPTNRPANTDHLRTDQPTTDQTLQPPTNRPPTFKKFEGQKKSE